MAKIAIKIVDPLKYDQGSKEEPTEMTYATSGAPVTIDTETAFVECGDKSAAINKWVADFDAHTMKLADDPAEGNFREIDLMAAMNMAGQMTKEIGVSALQTLLKSLSTIYNAEPGGDEKPEAPADDTPNTDNANQ